MTTVGDHGQRQAEREDPAAQADVGRERDYLRG